MMDLLHDFLLRFDEFQSVAAALALSIGNINLSRRDETKTSLSHFNKTIPTPTDTIPRSFLNENEISIPIIHRMRGKICAIVIYHLLLYFYYIETFEQTFFPSPFTSPPIVLLPVLQLKKASLKNLFSAV